MKPLKIYLGGPLFSEMEVKWNIELENKIKEAYGDKVSIYNPCNNDEINDKSNYADSIMIANGDNEFLEKADILIAQIDGQSPDVGMAAEVGYYFSLKKPIIGLLSDSRQGNVTEKKVRALEEVAESQWSYHNLYLIGLMKQRGPIARTADGLVEAIEQYFDEDARIV